MTQIEKRLIGNEEIREMSIVVGFCLTPMIFSWLIGFLEKTSV